MLSARRRAQLGLVTGTAIFLAAMGIVLAGAFEKPNPNAGQPGTRAATFRLPDLEGNMVSLGAQRGDVVVICFAPGPDSKPCEKNIHRMAELGQRYASNKDVKFFTIFSDIEDLSPRQTRAIEPLAEAAGPRCTTLLDPTHRISKRYNVAKIPAYIVIDAAGVIRYNGEVDDPSPDAPLSAARFTSLIDLLLAEKPASSQSAPALLSNIR
jgi:peroxiredoxin